MGEGTGPIAVTDASFQKEVLEAEQPTIVDFWASWCGPCKIIAPAFEELSNQYSGKVKFAKVNVDENPKTPANFGVRGIPTLIMFKQGQEAARIAGAMDLQNLLAWVRQNL